MLPKCNIEPPGMHGVENKRRENFLFRETLSVKLERGALGPCSALAETPMRKAKGMRRVNRVSVEILGSFIKAEAELLVLLRFHASCGLTATSAVPLPRMLRRKKTRSMYLRVPWGVDVVLRA